MNVDDINGDGIKTMKLLFTTAGLLIMIFATTGLAQDYKKIEFYGGYSAMQFDNIGGDTGSANIDDILGGRNTLRGFELAITANFHKWVGAKFDMSTHWREDEFTRSAGSGTIDNNIQNYLGGIQIKDNRNDGPRFKPFAHALIGVAHQRVDVQSPQLSTLFGVNELKTNETSFAQAYGGGVDIKLNDKIDIRVVQLDWNIINRGDQQVGTVTRVSLPIFPAVGVPAVIPGHRQDNFRIGAGIVIH